MKYVVFSVMTALIIWQHMELKNQEIKFACYKYDLFLQMKIGPEQMYGYAPEELAVECALKGY